MADQEMDIIDEILEDTAEDHAESILEQNILNEKTTSDFQEDAAPVQEKGEAPETETAGEADSQGADSQEEKDSSGKKGFFGKKKEKQDKKDEMIAELTDKLQRSLAEFNNFRNRTDKEKAAMYEIGARGVLEKILPVVDNFERGLAVAPEGTKEDSFAAGMDMIYKQLIKTLSDMGVQEIPAEGQEFNPDLHNAVMHVEDEALGENIIVEVFQKGYTYHDTVIRHAMVKVAN